MKKLGCRSSEMIKMEREGLVKWLKKLGDKSGGGVFGSG
jgi:hypothetical protein